jgi:hypothetical protein
MDHFLSEEEIEDLKLVIIPWGIKSFYSLESFPFNINVHVTDYQENYF